jgi:hypothetical protein
VVDAAAAAKEAVLTTTPDDELDMLEADAIESAAVAAASAACAALATEAQKKQVTKLVGEERAMVESLICSKPQLLNLLESVGATFHPSTHALEHTWTTSALPALDLALKKLKWLERPHNVPRFVPTGVDSRGLPTIRVVDGTNIAESAFGELEKPISTNGGYNENKWQGLLLNKIGRINERQRRKKHGIVGPGHYDLARARRHNELMRAEGAPLPHPHLAPLAPRRDQSATGCRRRSAGHCARHAARRCTACRTAHRCTTRRAR